MNRVLVLSVLLLTVLLVVLLVAGCGPKPQPTAPAASTASTAATNPAASAVVYTCPMHPEIQQSTPGTCPKCGMDLVKK